MGDFGEALAALLGSDSAGLSATTIARLKASWADDCERWTRHDLSAERYVYFWADSVYVRPRLDHDKQCLLMIIGADENGNKDIVGLSDGYRRARRAGCAEGDIAIKQTTMTARASLRSNAVMQVRTIRISSIALSAPAAHDHHKRMSALTDTLGSTSSVAVKAPTDCV